MPVPKKTSIYFAIELNLRKIPFVAMCVRKVGLCLFRY